MAKTETLGLGEMRSNFGKVRADMRTRIARKAVVAGGRILKAEAISIARANGSVRTSAMVNNIAIKRESKAGPDIEQVHLGVRHGREQTKKMRKQATKSLGVNSKGRLVTRYSNDPYYWKWVEFGHKIVARRGSKTGGKKSIRKRRMEATGTVQGKPFIGPALDRRRGDVIDAMGSSVATEVKKYGAP